jgi:beta-barrel assembly-enhancing protease
MEADKAGLARYLRTNYDLESIDGVFEVLLYSHLPFEDRHFQKSFFENDYIRFSSDYELEKINPIAAAADDDDDNGRSHPSIGKRRMAIKAGIQATSTAGRVKFMLPEARFREVQMLARFEVPMLSLHQEDYYRAIYEAWLLTADYPQNIYLEKCMLKGLYMASKYRNNGKKYVIKIDSIEGELQGMAHFMEKCSNADLAVLVTAYAWQLHSTYPQDEEIKTISRDALNELFFYHFDDLSVFSKGKAPAAVQPAPAPAAEEPKPEPQTPAKGQKEKSKLEKVRENTRQNNQNAVIGLQYALAPYLDNKAFEEAAAAARKTAQQRKDRKTHYESPAGQSELKDKKRQIKKKGRRMGIPKIVVVDPFYLNVDVRRENNKTIQFLQTEDSQKRFLGLMKDNARKTGLQATILDVASLKPADIEAFNDIALLNQWFAEQINFEDLSITPGLQQTEISAIAKKYGTRYFCWTGVISARRKSSPNYVYTLPIPSTWPNLVISAIEKRHECLYYNVIYDMETGGYDVVKFEYMKKSDIDMILNAHIYDSFLQIKSK